MKVTKDMNMVFNSIYLIRCAFLVSDETRNVTIQLVARAIRNNRLSVFCSKNDLIVDLAEASNISRLFGVSSAIVD